MKNYKLLNLVVVFTMLFLASCSKDPEPKPTVKSIVIATDKTTFAPEEAMTITVKTDAGKDVTSTSKIFINGKEVTSPYKAPTTEGDFKIKATYRERSFKELTSKEITVKAEKVVNSIAVTLTPNKTIFTPGEAITVAVKTDAGKDVTSDAKVFINGVAATKPYKAPTTEGDFKIKVTYKTFSKEITVKAEKVVNSIAVTLTPNKTIFTPGEAITVAVKTDAGKDVTAGFKVFIDGVVATKPYKVPTAEGDHTIKVTYRGVNKEIAVKVEKEVTSITLTPNKTTTFTPGEAITLTVKTDTGRDVSGDSKIFIDGREVSKPYKVPPTAGDYTIKATYKTFNKQITVNVAGAPQTTAIPDAKFEQVLIDLGYDDVIDGKVLTSKIYTVAELNVKNKEITNLTGIGDFTALTKLTCGGRGKLTNLDLTKNIALTNLSIAGNKFTNLDLTKNTVLTNLSIAGSELLTNLDLTKNIALTNLSIAGNKFTNLDLTKNTVLTNLVISYSELTNLDLSKNTALTNLVISYSKLTNLDLSKNTKLTSLNCNFNNQLTSLDLSKNTALTNLDISNSELTNLDLSKNTKLTSLNCNFNNQLTSLDLSKNIALTTLNFIRNFLTSLDLSKNTKLTSLNCRSNLFTNLDLSKNTKLTSLNCGSNPFTNLDLSKNIALTSLKCSSNKLANLDLRKNVALKSLYSKGGELKTIDLRNGKNTILTSVWIDYNPLTCFFVDDKAAAAANTNWHIGSGKYVETQAECDSNN